MINVLKSIALALFLMLIIFGILTIFLGILSLFLDVVVEIINYIKYGRKTKRSSEKAETDPAKSDSIDNRGQA